MSITLQGLIGQLSQLETNKLAAEKQRDQSMALALKYEGAIEMVKQQIELFKGEAVAAAESEVVSEPCDQECSDGE